jgi:hypothetical protein
MNIKLLPRNVKERYLGAVGSMIMKLVLRRVGFESVDKWDKINLKLGAGEGLFCPW